MNANLQPTMPAIKQWLNDASKQLADADIPSANLDSELILANALGKDRTYLHAHPEQIVQPDIYSVASEGLKQRIKRIPIAYIVGYKEFYGRKFIVDSSVLIPRPESEDVIELLKKKLSPSAFCLPHAKLIDVGTGSGCIGITCKLEFPQFEVTLSDTSNDALKTAKTNAVNHSVKVHLAKSNLLSNADGKFDVIVANLPYVDKKWDVSIETKYEPKDALFASNNGLELILKLILQSTDKINTGGLLILESDPRQHQEISDFAVKNGYELLDKSGYILMFKWPN